MNEMNKLIKLLAKADIPFEVTAHMFPDFEKKKDDYEMKAWVQVVSPSVADCKIDAIYHPGSYGYKEGLLEIMGPPTEECGDGVVGYLTAEEALEHFRRVMS